MKKRKNRRYIWLLMTDKHNGSVDFQTFSKGGKARRAYVEAVNDIFGTKARTFDKAMEIYERENETPFNEDFIRFESVLLQ